MATDNKATNTKTKKSGRFGKFFRELGSELKKVSWPTFGKTMKQTGIVLIVTCSFLFVVMGIDAGLGALYNYIVSLF